MRHIREWWLVGMPIKETQDWFAYTLHATGGADITNHYIWWGLTGGVGSIALLVLVLVRGFGLIGRVLTRARQAGAPGRRAELVLWGMGIMLAVHAVNWFGISYFDQFYVIWFLHLAAISSVAGLIWRRTDVRAVRDLSPEPRSDAHGTPLVIQSS
jgi:hypothetical protein